VVATDADAVSAGEELPRGRILVADDDPVSQRLAALMLTTLGYEVDVVGDGRAALLAVGQTRYETVLVDVHMPELDGEEVTRWLLTSVAHADRPWIIALTANALTEERNRCLTAGMDDFVSKPMSRAILGAALERGRHGRAARSASFGAGSDRTAAAVA
jgi:CheY-like chemotaxis protein